MTEYNEGDLVRVERGEVVIQDRLAASALSSPRGRLYLPASPKTHYIDVLEAEGYTVSVVERATPPLPTDDGFYIDRRGLCWSIENTGDWRFGGTTFNPEEVARYAPFIRLEPVPVTAKRVLDALRTRIGSLGLAYDYELVAIEFGVTS